MNGYEKMRDALMKAIGNCADCNNDCRGCLNPKATWMPEAKEAITTPRRNCDIPAKNMGELCDRFYDYVRRNNPACIRTSPLYTYHDAMKWMLDEANTNKEA